MWRYYGMRLSVVTLSRLPFWLGRIIADLVGLLAYRFSKKSRAALEDNLRRVLGKDTDPARLRRIVRRSFRNLMRNYYDLTRLPRCSPQKLSERIEFIGLENVRPAQKSGRGVVICTAHLGNYELVPQVALAISLHMTFLVERLQPERLWQYWMGLRRAQGMSFEPADRAGIKAAFKTLRQGGIVALASDRVIQGGGIVTRFMGEQTLMPSGAAELALRTGAALIPAFSVRTHRNRYRISFEAPIPLPDGRHTEDDVRQAVDRCIAVMERHIRGAPEQWLVFQPVWGNHLAEPPSAVGESARQSSSTSRA